MIEYIQYTLEIEELKKEIAKLKKRAQESEGELTIIKGIGMNSPEFLTLKKENEELRDDNKKLAQQIQDKNTLVGRLRDKGLI
jgi:FtsZ-binding cell division protein ZapB